MSTESPSSAPVGTGSQPPPPPPDETAPSAAPAPPTPTVTSASPGPPIPPPPPPPRVRRRPLNRLRRFGRTGGAVVVVTVVIVLALVGGTAWGAVRARSIQTHRTPPTVQAALDLSNLGDSPTPVPIGPEGPESRKNSQDSPDSEDSEETVVLASGQTRVLRVAQDGREALVGIDLASASGYPAWQAPVPDELVGQALNCDLAQDVLDCGDLLSIDLATGVNRASEPSALSASVPGPASSGDSQTSAPDASPDPSADGSRSPAAGSTSTTSTAPTASTTSARSARSVRLNDSDAGSTSDPTPLAVSPDGVLTADGATVKGLELNGAATVWAAHLEVPRTLIGIAMPMTRRVWVVSDGTTMAAIDGSTLLWSSPLPQGAAELNSLGVQDPPRWLVHQGAIVMAHPDGIVALDPVDGSTVWRVAGPVTSWSASGDALVVFNGSTASLLSFGKNSATATALPSSAPTTASAPDQEDLKNSTLEVPDLCKPAGSQDPATGKTLAAFVDGTATGTAPGAAPPSATMRALQPGVFDGSPVMIAVLRCYGGGNTAFDAIAVYDSDKALIGSVDHVMQDDIGETPDLVIENLRSVGNTVIYSVPGIKVAGDTACHACAGGAEATVTAQWDGDSLEVADVLYRLPSGAVRIPATQDVQVAYDAIASDDEATAEDLVEQSVLNELDQHLGLGQDPASTVRAVQFPTGGRVVGCELAGPDGTPYSMSGNGQAVSAGTIACPVTTDDPTKPWLHPKPDQYGRRTYASWLILHADERGHYKVIGIGRTIA